MFLSRCVGEDLVGAAQNERDAEPSVFDAQDEAAAVASFSHLVGPISLLTFSSTRPIPCASYQCTICAMEFSIGKVPGSKARRLTAGRRSYVPWSSLLTSPGLKAAPT